MVSCTVPGCKNRSERISGLVGFHSFPLKNTVLLKKWLDALQIDRIVVNKHCKVCSQHFSPEDYKRDLRHELIGSRTKRQLREGAIPRIYNNPNTTTQRMAEATSPESPNEADAHDPLSDPLAGDNDIDIVPEFEIKEEPYDYYEDNVTDTGSPCWISDGVTLIDDNDEDIELDSDPFQYVGKHNNVLHDEALEIQPVPQKLPKKGGKSKKMKVQRYPQKRKRDFSAYEVDVDDSMDEDDLEVAIESVALRDDAHNMGWKNKKMSESQLNMKRMELESHLTQCKLNIKVMQARLDEERGKMMRIQNSLINLRRRQKRNELKKLQRGNGHVMGDGLAVNKKSMKSEMKGIIMKKLDSVRDPEMVFQNKMKMAKLREIKAQKALEEKNAGITDYKKELENKLRMARLREIKAQRALERKLNEDRLTPESKIKINIKPMKIPKYTEDMNSEEYEKMLEMNLRMARLREIKAMKALERANEDSDKPSTDVTFKPKMKKPKVKRLKIKLKLPKSDSLTTEEEKEEMKKKMAKLREIKAQKALERKQREEAESLQEEKKKDPEKKTTLEPNLKMVQEAEHKSLVTIKQEPGVSSEGESKPEIHIATSHMLWNVLSRIKLEPYQGRTSKDDDDSSASSYFSNPRKNEPQPEDIPKLVRDFFLREDVSKVSTVTPNATPGDSSSVRYRMHYLPILHKQFEAENGNVCSYASFCNNVPENVVKPHAWQWKFCPCLPCINPEMKFEKMLSEGILEMECVELGDILHDDTKENMLMLQLRDLRESKQFFTYDSWERSASGAISAKRRTASEPIGIVITKFIEELSMLKSHIQRTFYQYHCSRLARDRSLSCVDEVTLHIECSPLTLLNNLSTEASSSEPTKDISVFTGYLWSQNCEQALAAVSESKDFTISGIWAGLEKILLSIVKAGKKKINIISDSPTNKYRNKSNFYYMRDFAQTYGVCFRWIFLELSHQIGNANIIRGDIENTIKEQIKCDPDMSLSINDIQNILHSKTSIIVDSYKSDDVQKYKWNLPKLKVVQGTQKFDEVIILPEDFWVRDIIGFDTFKKLPF